MIRPRWTMGALGFCLSLLVFASTAFAQFTPTITQTGGPSGTVFPGTSFTMVATVSSAGPTPTGSVTFQRTDGAGNPQTNYCSVTLSNGSASCTFAAPGDGAYRIRLIYSGDTFTAAGSQDFAFTSQQASPTIVQGGGPSGTVLPGTSYTMTATVLSSGPTPTGSVTFQRTDAGGNPQTNYCSVTLSNGSASCTFTAPPNGSYRIRLIYSGDTPTAPASQDFPFTSQQATPTITQAGGPSGTVLPGVAFTMTATVSSPGPMPTGSVTFQRTDAGGNPQTNYCTVALSNGSASCAFAAPPNGSYRLRLIYSGDTPTTGGVQDFPFTTSQASVAISQSGGPAGTVLPATSFTMTATVASPGPTPTGSVTFQRTDGAGNPQTNHCSVALSNGSATCAFTAPGNGVYRVRVIYSGDTFNAGTSQDFPFTSQQATPTIAQSGGPSGTVLPGETFTMTATVSSPGPTPTGSVTFQRTDGSGNPQTNYCTGTLASGSASCTFTAPPSGSYRLRLIYSGDTPTAGGFQDFSFVSQQAVPRIVQTGGPSGTVLPGTSYTMTATVLSSGPTPTGSVTFQRTDGAGNAQTNHCTVALTNGSASCTFTAPPNGSYRLRLIYTGDTPTTSGFQDFSFVSQQATPVITQSGGPAGTVLAGSSFTMTAMVSSPGPTPTGSVTFQRTDGSGNPQTNYCTVALASGSASCTFTAPTDGTYRIRLVYSGDTPTASGFADFPFSSSSSGSSPPPTVATPTLTQSGAPSGTVIPGASFTMTATVSSPGPAPTGTVTFTLFAANGGNNGSLCGAVTLSGGNASCTFAAPASGAWFIRVGYSGDSNTASATQDYAFSTQQVAPTITQSGAPSGTVIPGTTFTMVATVSSTGPTPTGTVSFKLYQSNGGDNATLCANVALSGGNAGCTFTAPAAGSWFVRAFYSGDTATTAGTQDFAFVTQQATPTVSLTGNPSGTVLPGSSFAMTVTVTSVGPTPTGSVSVDLYNTGGGFQSNLCATTLSGGSASCNMAAAPANGSYFIRVTYGGDTPTAGRRADFPFSSQQATPTITQAGGPTGTVAAGTSFTMTATVSSPGPTPTGTVTFKLFNSTGGDNGTLGSNVALVNGSASVTFSAPPPGSWFIRVTYSGDTPTASGLNDFPFAAQRATPTITQTGGPTGTVFPGTAYTMQAQILSSGFTPTGNATFTLFSSAGANNGTFCLSAPLTGGTATCSFNAPANGAWFIRVNYSGDSNTSSAFQDFAFVTNDAALAISPASLTFPTTAVGSSSAPQTVTLTNPGNTTVNFSSITVPPGYSKTTTCGASLPSSASCTVDVTFTPGTAGTVTGNLVIASDVVGSPQTVSLTGTGALPPSAAKAFSPSTILAGGTSTLTVTISNFNPFPIDITLVDVYPSGMVNAALPNASATCTNGSPNASAAGGSVSFTSSGAGVPANGQCTVQVDVTAGLVGTYTNTIPAGAIGPAGGLASSFGPSTSSASAVLTVSAVPAPAVSLSPAAINFGSVTVGTTSAPVSATLTNTGNATLIVSSLTLPPQVTSASTCVTPYSLAPGGSCNYDFFFTPAAAGAFAGSASFASNAATSPDAIALAGNGTAAPVPAVSLSPPSLAFAPQTVGTTSASQSVTLTNGGTGTLNIASKTISGDFAYSTNCATTLAAGSSCNFNVTFTPIASGGRVGQLVITDDAAGSPHIVPLSGTSLSTAAPTLSLSAAALSFPDTTVGTQSAAQDVTITNTGMSPLTIFSVSSGLEFPALTTCRSSLAPGSSCAAIVAFQPQVPGTRTAVFTIVSDAATSPDNVALSGIGVLTASAALVARPASIVMATPVAVGGRSLPVTLVIANTGSGPAQVTSISVEGDFAATGSCATIDAGGACSLTVEFAPTQTGIREGMLLVRSTASNGILAIALEGRGAPAEPQATLDATSLAFGNQLQFVLSAPLALTLTNTGLAPLLLGQIAATGGFVQDNDCGRSLVPFASCRINVRMFGTQPGPATGELRITSNAPDARAALSGTTCRIYSVLRTMRGLLTCVP